MQKEKVLKILDIPIVFGMMVMAFFMVEILSENHIFQMKVPQLVANFCCYFILYTGVRLLIPKVKAGFISLHILLFVVGLINNIVIQLRGTPVTVGDIFVANTALAVADKFVYVPTQTFWKGLVLLFLLIGVTCLYQPVWKIQSRKQYWVVTACYMVVAVGSIWWSIQGDFVKNHVLKSVSWNPKLQCEENGFLLNLLGDLSYANMEEPEGYDKEETMAILSNQSVSEIQTANGGTEPNIIVIMNETFADLDVIGEIETSDEVMPFIQELREDETVLSGNVYVSAFGGNTGNTEFEVLTGNTTAFLPGGTVPYVRYLNKGRYDSMVSVLENQPIPYQTVAMHPYDKSGYQRASVYSNLGFDKRMFLEDFEVENTIREYVSDDEDYENLIRVFEEKNPEQPIFIFNVTIQNHGGYGYYPAECFANPIYVESFDAKTELEEYLSLIRTSDEAFRKLIAYFETVDEPTMIVMFGDHMPALSEETYDTIREYGDIETDMEYSFAKHVTPYLIWANFELSNEEAESISANYFGSYILQTAGITGSGYNEYLMQLYESYPVIISNGIMDQKGNLYNLKELSKDEVFQEYKKIEYMYLFDNKGTENCFGIEQK